ncbi:MAG: hypothetical protein WDM76_15605 [Limisphaerales bacterium]
MSLQLEPPGDSGRVIVGLPDMAVQSLGEQLDKFILPKLSATDDAPVNGSDISHGTSMAYTILQAIAQASDGGSSVQNPACGYLRRERDDDLLERLRLVSNWRSIMAPMF